MDLAKPETLTAFVKKCNYHSHLKIFLRGNANKYNRSFRITPFIYSENGNSIFHTKESEN
jgi:hypothetical protein